MKSSKQKKGLATVSESKKKEIQEKALATRRKNKAEKVAKGVAGIDFPLVRSVQYKEAELNNCHDRLLRELVKVVEVSKKLDGDKDRDVNLVAAVSVGFSSLAGFAHDNGISLMDFLRIIEAEANVMIQEVRVINQHAPEGEQ